MTFAEHKEQTAKDCEQVAKMFTDLADQCREGDLDAFIQMWLEDGTEKGDVMIQQVREMMVLRFVHRQENIERKSINEKAEEVL